MSSHKSDRWSRRQFLSTAALAGTGAMLGWPPEPSAAEPPPETARLRLLQTPSICWAPQYVAEELLKQEGFTHVQYVKSRGGEEGEKMLSSGEVDITMGFAARHILRMDAGDPTVVLGGLHIGCFELVGDGRIRSVRDLKGKSVAVTQLGSGRHVFFATIAAYVGLDPRKDFQFVTDPPAQSIKQFTDGKIDGYMAFAPEPQELRANKVGHVLVDSMMDKPWSQYFCCLVVGNREFVQRNPVATKKVLRSFLKANDVTAREPDRATSLLVDRGITKAREFALEAVRGMHYERWRDYDPEDTLRFYALRLHEAGMVKSTPNKLIAQGTDWRFLNELKKELKG
ncbi:MAG TPA: ABC transporter substrate-binding protein [Thermoleophilia bacterium]|nr:ABC transporter substrate-binding protein [Thermoleophilia bacterium]